MRNRPGNLYFLQVDPLGPIKIGFTDGDPCCRMRALQQSSPYELKWIGVKRALKQDEPAAHKLLAAYRIRSEWLHPAAAVLDFVREQSPNFDPDTYIDEQYDRALQKRYAAFRRANPIRYNDPPSEASATLDRIGIETRDLWAWRETRRALTKDQMETVRRELDTFDAHRAPLEIAA